MYRFGIDYSAWDNRPVRPVPGLSRTTDGDAPKLKDVMLEIGVTLGVALAFALVAEVVIGLVGVT